MRESRGFRGACDVVVGLCGGRVECAVELVMPALISSRYGGPERPVGWCSTASAFGPAEPGGADHRGEVIVGGRNIRREWIAVWSWRVW